MAQLHEFASYGNKQRLTQARKNANNKQWYKDNLDQLDHRAFGGTYNHGTFDVSTWKSKKINYDLFNNEIDLKEFNYVCKPFGEEMGELPANFVNRDIVSGKIKVLLGMEMKMPFSWKVVATNSEATTRREQEEAKMIRDFVVNDIMSPIRMEIEKQKQEQIKGKPLSPQEQQQLQQQIEEEVQAKTPDEVRKYMQRDHQDPAEMLNQQILQYLIYKEKIPEKFNKGWKHATLSGEDLYWVGIVNGEPVLKVVNPMRFDSDSSDEIDCISEGEWATYEMHLSPSQIVEMFGSEMTDEEIDRVYDRSHHGPSRIEDLDWSFNAMKESSGFTHRVLHCEWKSLRKIGFLYYRDENGETQMELVDENYKINRAQGDLKIEWDWIPEVHEGYKVMNDMYFYCRPVQGQHTDLDNIYKARLSYFGSRVDNLNSKVTSPMDRIRNYQYLYNVIIYRIELLMASDKGKILAANIGRIPSTSGLNTDEFMYFLEANKIAFFNNKEEGDKFAGNVDANSTFSVLDMSLASDLAKYIEIANLIERRTGQAIGVTPQMEAQIASNEAVTNTKQNLVQASHIIQPYFELHNNTKANVLNGLLEKAKIAYSTGKPRKLTYILDDMSTYILDLNRENMDMLSNSTMGLFVANSSKAHDAKEAVNTLAQAAMQNQQADLGDILKVIRSESITEAEELLETARQRKRYEENAFQMEQLQTQERMDQARQEHERDLFEREKELIVLKEEERRKTVIQAETIKALGYGTAKDSDGDGQLDLMEVYKLGQKADVDAKKIILDAKKLEHTIQTDQKKLQQTDEKLKIDRIKANKPAASSK
jgi:hypothetical protein